MNTNKPEKDKSIPARGSKAFAKAEFKAEEYVKDPKKLTHLIDNAIKKASNTSGVLAEIQTSVTAIFRLIKAYANGSYTAIPWQSLTMIVAAVVYFVMPLDFIPDFILGLGLADDAAILGWAIKTFGSDINDFIEWENKNKSDADEL